MQIRQSVKTAGISLRTAVEKSKRHLPWLLIGLYSSLAGCRETLPPTPDVILPQVLAQPAGGIFHALPQRIILRSTKDAGIYYTVDGSHPTVKSQSYSAPIVLKDSDVTLRFFARDTAGNHSAMQVEHYRRFVGAPQITIRTRHPFTLSPQQSASLRWVCEQRCGRFRLTAGAGGWESSIRLHAGTAQAGQEVRSTIVASRLSSADTRLWVHVKSDEGILGAASLPLSIDRQAPRVYAWPAGGTYGALPSVVLFADEAATVYYTTDGSPPTLHSAVYEAPIRLRGDTTLRFLAIDRFGNQGGSQTESYRFQKHVPTVHLQQFPGTRLDVSATLRFTWRSSQRGRYLLSANGQALLRGQVERNTPMQSTVHGWALDAPHNRLRLRVTDDAGREGSVSFLLDTFFRETFTRDAALDNEATTAHWDATASRITLPTGPLLTGAYDTSRTSRGVASQGNYAYVANTRGGLRILDLSTPKKPRPVGSLFMYGEPKALAKYEHYIYLAADTSGMQIFDVSNPQAPLLVGHQHLPGGASAIVITGTRAYVGTQRHGLYVYDLTNPRRPNRLAHLALEMPVMHLTSTTTHLYVAGFNGGVGIVDITTPTIPRLLSTISLGPYAGAALGVAVHAQRLYVAANALMVFDVENPAQPRHLTQLALSSAYGLAIHRGRIYVADQYQGLHIVETETPRPRILGTYDTPNRAVRLALQGQIAFVADLLGGLQLIDISQPEHPTLLQSLPKLGQIVDVWVEGDFAYLANRKGRARLLVVDVRHPGQARIVGTYRNGSLTDVVLSGPLAYVLDAFGGLQVLDVSQPQRPVLVGAQRTHGVGQGLTLYGRYALVAAGTAGLHIIDVSRPTQPTTVTRLALPGESVDVATWGRYAYVATGAAGIAIIDLTQPTAPRQVGSVRRQHNDEGEKIVRLAIRDSYLYASDTTPELLIFSLESPQQPRLLRQTASPHGTLWALAFHGHLLYATTILRHLTVFDLADPAQTRVIGAAASGARDLAVALPYLLLATESYRRRGGGLRVLETHAPVSPRFSPADAAEPVAAFDVATTGSHIYVAAGTAGLMVGRFSATGQFQRRAHMPWHDTAQRLITCGPLAYVGGQHSLAAVDITVPTNPRLLSTMDLDTAVADLACAGNLLLLATAERGLLLVDVSHPAQPSLQAAMPIPGGLQHVAWWGGGYALGAGARGQLTLFDLTIPSQPHISWRLDLDFPIRDLVIYGNRAYVAAAASGLHAVPLQTAGPQPSRAIWDGAVLALALRGRWAYLVDQHQGLVSLDLSHPLAPRQLGATPLELSSPAGPAGLRLLATDTTLLLAGGEQGLQRATSAVSRTSVRVPQAIVQSFKVDTATHPVASATLWARDWPGAHGRIIYEVSNNGGDTWGQVLPGIPYRFSTSGNDLRWRAVLRGATPLADPALYEIQLTYELAASGL